MFRSIVDTTEAFEDSASSVGPELRGAVALALHEFAGALRAFARLVGADARPGRTQVSDVEQAREAVLELGETRARITDFLLVDDDPVRAELNFALLATIKRLLAELDLDERARRQRLARQPVLLRSVRRRSVPPPTHRR
jgi:hypothetical protein